MHEGDGRKDHRTFNFNITPFTCRPPCRDRRGSFRQLILFKVEEKVSFGCVGFEGRGSETRNFCICRTTITNTSNNLLLPPLPLTVPAPSKIAHSGSAYQIISVLVLLGELVCAVIVLGLLSRLIYLATIAGASADGRIIYTMVVAGIALCTPSFFARPSILFS
jgi:hypothetical protein